MSQGNVQDSQSAEGNQPARNFVKGLISRFQIKIEAEAKGAQHPKARFEAERAPNPTTELLKPFAARFKQAAAVDGSKLPQNLQSEVTEKKKQFTAHLKNADLLVKRDKNIEAANVEISKANEIATQLLSRRYQLDKDGNPVQPKELTPEVKVGDNRDFTGKELLDQYKHESRTHYENANEQNKSADYVDSTGHLVDQDGKIQNSSDGMDMYTSRLDKGTSHRFDESTGHHSYATEGTDVIGAGRRVVERGIIRKVTGDSGHYAPSALNIHEYVEGMFEQGVKMIDDEKLFMPDPIDPESNIEVRDQEILNAWREVVEYEQSRAKQKANGETLEEYDPQIAKQKQQLSDKGVWPGQRDTEIDAVKEGILTNDDELTGLSDGITTGMAPTNEQIAKAETIVLNLLKKRFGDQVYHHKTKDPIPLTASFVLGNINFIRTNKGGLPSIKDLTQATKQDINSIIGVILRMKMDVSGTGESKARVELDAQQFLQTGGNSQAIQGKSEVNKQIESQPSKLKDGDSDNRVAEMYANLGGDQTLASKFKVHDPGSIGVDLKYAWLIKGRITDDSALNKLLLDRFGTAFNNKSILTNASIELKLKLLESDKCDDSLQKAFVDEQSEKDLANYQPPDLSMMSGFEVPMSDFPVIARLCGMELDAFLKEVPNQSDMTFSEIARHLGISDDEFHAKLTSKQPTKSAPIPTSNVSASSNHSSSNAFTVPSGFANNISIPTLGQMDSFLVMGSQFGELANLLGITLDQLKGKLSGDEYTWTEIAQAFGMTNEAFLTKIGGDPNAVASPVGSLSSDSSIQFSSNHGGQPSIGGGGTNTGPTKLDLRKVRKDTSSDPNAKPYEEAGGDNDLLDKLLSLWKKQNVQALSELQALEKTRNELKKKLATEKASDEQIDSALKQLDETQSGQRQPLKSKLKASRPQPSDLDELSIESKLQILLNPDDAKLNEILLSIAQKNAG